MRTKDLTGKRFGRLRVIGIDPKSVGSHETKWICVCDCGGEKVVATSHLNCGTVRSCGCLRKEQAISRFRKAAENNITHGESRSSLYSVWHTMHQRCENPQNPAYKWYGAKGIKVCHEWKDYAVFAEWAKASGYKYLTNVERKYKLSIDRIDSNGDYCPDNCRWITISENSRRGSLVRWQKDV